MARKSSLYLPIKSWPAEDQWRWQAAFRVGDRFDGGGPGSHLAHATRQNLTEGYGRFLRFITTNRSDLLDLMPDQRVDPRTVADYVGWRRRSRGDATIAIVVPPSRRASFKQRDHLANLLSAEVCERTR